MVWFCCLLCCLFICLWVCCFPAWFFLLCCVVIYLSAFVICFCGYSFFLSLLFIFHWVFLFVYFCGYSFASFVCVCVYLLYICFCCFLCGYYLFICVYLLVCFCKKFFTCTCLFVWLYWCLKPVLIFFNLLSSRKSLQMKHFSKTNKWTFGDDCGPNTHSWHFRFNWGVFVKGVDVITPRHNIYKINKRHNQSYLRLRISRACVQRMLSDSTRCSPGLSRMQRLTCLHWKSAKTKRIVGLRTLCNTIHAVQLLEPWTSWDTTGGSMLGLWGHGVQQWNRTVGIWLTWPTQVSSHEASVTHVEVARCEFQASSGVWTDWSVFRCRFKLKPTFNAGVFRCLSCSFAQVLSFTEHLQPCVSLFVNACLCGSEMIWYFPALTSWKTNRRANACAAKWETFPLNLVDKHTISKLLSLLNYLPLSLGGTLTFHLLSSKIYSSIQFTYLKSF